MNNKNKKRRSFNFKNSLLLSCSLASSLPCYCMENDENIDKEWEFLASYESLTDSQSDKVLTVKGNVRNLIAKFSETEQQEDTSPKSSQNTVRYQSSYKVSSSGNQNSLSKNSSENYNSIGFGSQRNFDSLPGTINSLRIGHNTQKNLLEALARIQEDGERPLSPFNSSGKKTGTISGLKLATIDRQNNSKRVRKNSVLDIFSFTKEELDKNASLRKKHDPDIPNIQSSNDEIVVNLQLNQEESLRPILNQLPSEPENSSNNQKLLEQQIALFELSCSYCEGATAIQEDIDQAFNGFKIIYETTFDEILKIKAGNNLGILYHRIGQSTDAINLLTECYCFTIENSDNQYKKLGTLIANNLGVVHAQAPKADYQVALDYYQVALDYLNLAQLNYTPVEFIKHNIGYVQLALKNYNEAIRNFIDVDRALKDNPKIFEDEIKLIDIQYTIGKLYFDLEKYTDALPYLEAAADAENADAQFHLGFMHEQGYGLDKKDYEKASILYQKASIQNHSQANENFNNLEDLGVIPLNINIDQLIKLADDGDAEAQNYIGVEYHYGTNVPTNHTKAVEYLQRAAAQSLSLAMFNLGVFYKKGLSGLPQSYMEARKWFEKAVDQGDVKAKYYLGVMYEKGRGGLGQSDDQAVLWYKKAADQELDTAKKALERLAKNGHKGAQQALNEINQKNTVFKMVVSPLKELNNPQL